MGIRTKDQRAIDESNEAVLTHDFGTHFCARRNGCTEWKGDIAPAMQVCVKKKCPELLLKIRKSMLESYSFCPMQFYWTYIQGRRAREVQHMVVGTRFHEFAQRFFDYYTAVDETLEAWESLIPDEFNEAEREMAEWWLGYQLQRLRDLREHGRESEWFPIAREQQMDNPTHGLTSTVDAVEWLDKDIDPVTNTETWSVGKATRQVCIVEYKTGRKMSIESAIRQCTFYALLWQMNGNVGRVTHVKLVNPRLMAYSVYKLKREDIELAILSVLRLREIIAKGVYRQVCSEGKYAACHMCDLETLKIFPPGMWKNGRKFVEYMKNDKDVVCDVSGDAPTDEELLLL